MFVIRDGSNPTPGSCFCKSCCCGTEVKLCTSVCVTGDGFESYARQPFFYSNAIDRRKRRKPGVDVGVAAEEGLEGAGLIPADQQLFVRVPEESP